MGEETLNRDIKTALLAGDKPLIVVLRSLKSAILYTKIAEKLERDQELPEAALVSLLQKEAKKRQESADLYRQGGSEEKAAAELYEKEVIEKYLPAQLSETELALIIDDVIRALGATQSTMGQVIAQVRQKTAGSADGSVIARLVKEKLQA